MNYAIISILLCKVLFFGCKLEVCAADCLEVQLALNACIQELNDASDDGLSQIPLSQKHGTDDMKEQLLTNDLSITELYRVEKGENWRSDPLLEESDTDNQLSICNNQKSESNRQKIMKAIEKVLKFYSSHKDVVLRRARDLPGLSILKGVDDKYNKEFQIAYNVSNWLIGTCNQVAENRKDVCFKKTKLWAHHQGKSWKSKSVVDSIEQKSVGEIGHEKEYVWCPLSGQCQLAVLDRCEVPHICEQVVYDPIPGSKYFLAKQILQRIFTQQSDCPEAQRLLSEEVNDQLCSKMYQEAKLISAMGYPHILRDIFAESVALCGFLRYPNFFRQDWIENILSWQSESEYGCFVHEKGYQPKFWTSDTPIVRRSDPNEKQQGLVPDEECLPHYTVWALSALSMSWDYMEENCK